MVARWPRGTKVGFKRPSSESESLSVTVSHSEDPELSSSPPYVIGNFGEFVNFTAVWTLQYTVVVVVVIVVIVVIVVAVVLLTPYCTVVLGREISCSLSLIVFYHRIDYRI